MFLVKLNDFKLKLAVFLFVNVNALNIPPYHKACKFSDSKFEQCILSVANTVLENYRKGDTTLIDPRIKELKVPFIQFTDNIDTTLNISDGTTSGYHDMKLLKIRCRKPGLKCSMICGVCNGKACENVTQVTLDESDEYDLDLPFDIYLSTEEEFDELKKTDVYPEIETNIFTVESIGTNESDDIHYTCNFEWKLIEKNGEKYSEVTKVEISSEYGNVNYNIDGVDSKALNDNWMEPISKIMPTIIPFLEQIFHGFTDIIFNEIPYKKLFLD